MTTPTDYSPDYSPPTPELRTYRNSAGIEVQGVQLTKTNMRAVFEWSDSKQFFEPDPTDQAGTRQVVTGLTIFTSAGRRKANFGDWVIRWPGGDFDRYDALTFGQFFTETQP